MIIRFMQSAGWFRAWTMPPLLPSMQLKSSVQPVVTAWLLVTNKTPAFTQLTAGLHHCRLTAVQGRVSFAKLRDNRQPWQRESQSGRQFRQCFFCHLFLQQKTSTSQYSVSHQQPWKIQVLPTAITWPMALLRHQSRSTCCASNNCYEYFH